MEEAKPPGVASTHASSENEKKSSEKFWLIDQRGGLEAEKEAEVVVGEDDGEVEVIMPDPPYSLMPLGIFDEIDSVTRKFV